MENTKIRLETLSAALSNFLSEGTEGVPEKHNKAFSKLLRDANDLAFGATALIEILDKEMPGPQELSANSRFASEIVQGLKKAAQG